VGNQKAANRAIARRPYVGHSNILKWVESLKVVVRHGGMFTVANKIISQWLHPGGRYQLVSNRLLSLSNLNFLLLSRFPMTAG
jgi:hypothetical protein